MEAHPDGVLRTLGTLNGEERILRVLRLGGHVGHERGGSVKTIRQLGMFLRPASNGRVDSGSGRSFMGGHGSSTGNPRTRSMRSSLQKLETLNELRCVALQHRPERHHGFGS